MFQPCFTTVTNCHKLSTQKKSNHVSVSVEPRTPGTSWKELVFLIEHLPYILADKMNILKPPPSCWCWLFSVQIDEGFLSFWFKSRFNIHLNPCTHCQPSHPTFHAVVYVRSFCLLRYLASSISFTEQTDVGLLTINLFKKDQHAELGLLFWGSPKNVKKKRTCLAVWHHPSKWRHLYK